MSGNLLVALRRFWDRIQPGFWRRMKPSYRAATAITVLVVLWIGSGVFSLGGTKQSDDAQAKTAQMPSVQVERFAAQNRDASITVRGRTQALHSVDVKAEVDGVVQALHFEKGDFVKAGQVLCELKTNDRAPGRASPRGRWS